jgi:PleD family two-component response regulator
MLILDNYFTRFQMNKKGDIIIIEDDPDEWEVMLDIFEQVMDEEGYTNRVVIFEESAMLIDFLKESNDEPFIIISDINMPLMDGFELREKIDTELKINKTPFVFLTTSDSDSFMGKAKELDVNGYYVKPVKLEEYKKLIKDILGQWMQCTCAVEA